MKRERNTFIRNGGNPQAHLKPTGLKPTGKVLFTTTDIELPEDLLSRCIVLSVDESGLLKDREMKGEPS